MALFSKLSMILLFSFVTLSIGGVQRKDTESLPDVSEEEDPESKFSYKMDEYICSIKHNDLIILCGLLVNFKNIILDCYTDDDCPNKRVCIDYHCAKGI